MSESKWNKIVEPFLADLKFGDKRDLLNESKLRQAYESSVKPLLFIAKSLGFTPGWYHRK